MNPPGSMRLMARRKVIEATVSRCVVRVIVTWGGGRYW